MGRFSFRTDAEAEQYCQEILDILTGHYRLSPSEALHLLNTGWKGQDFLGPLDLRYHKGDPGAWAVHIMSHWRDS